MNANNIINSIRASGGSLTVADGRLRYTGPREVREDWIGEIAAHRVEIVAALLAANVAATAPQTPAETGSSLATPFPYAETPKSAAGTIATPSDAFTPADSPSASPAPFYAAGEASSPPLGRLGSPDEPATAAEDWTHVNVPRVGVGHPDATPTETLAARSTPDPSASVARYREWQITEPVRPTFSVICSPAATVAEMGETYPLALSVVPEGEPESPFVGGQTTTRTDTSNTEPPTEPTETPEQRNARKLAAYRALVARLRAS